MPFNPSPDRNDKKWRTWVEQQIRALQATRTGPGSMKVVTYDTGVVPGTPYGTPQDGGGPYVTAYVGSSGMVRIDATSQVAVPGNALASGFLSVTWVTGSQWSYTQSVTPIWLDNLVGIQPGTANGTLYNVTGFAAVGQSGSFYAPTPLTPGPYTFGMLYSANMAGFSFAFNSLAVTPL